MKRFITALAFSLAGIAGATACAPERPTHNAYVFSVYRREAMRSPFAARMNDYWKTYAGRPESADPDFYRNNGDLLRRALPSKGRFKDFYVELTMVVRRYIERRYAIRAPRQTTEEFLEAARNNRDFSVETLDGLRAFLAAADLVKFAGAEATPELADEAVGKARAYLEAERTAETPAAADGGARRRTGRRQTVVPAFYSGRV